MPHGWPGGGAWAQLELTDTLCNEVIFHNIAVLLLCVLMMYVFRDYLGHLLSNAIYINLLKQIKFWPQNMINNNQITLLLYSCDGIKSHCSGSDINLISITYQFCQ